MPAQSSQDKAKQFRNPTGAKGTEGILGVVAPDQIKLVGLTSMEVIDLPHIGETLLMNPSFNRSIRGSIVGLAPNRLLLGRINKQDGVDTDLIYNNHFIVSAVQEQDLSELAQTQFQSESEQQSLAWSLSEGDEDQIARMTSNSDENIINSNATSGENAFSPAGPDVLSRRMNTLISSLSAELAGEQDQQEKLQMFKKEVYIDKNSFKDISINKKTSVEPQLVGLNRRLTDA